MTTNTMSPATLTIRFLIKNAPFHVRSIVAPIYTNYQLNDDYACLRSISKALGPRELPYLYEAAELAAETHAAVDTLSADAEIPDELLRARLVQLNTDDDVVRAILDNSQPNRPFPSNTAMRAAAVQALRRLA